MNQILLFYTQTLDRKYHPGWTNFHLYIQPERTIFLSRQISTS